MTPERSGQSSGDQPTRDTIVPKAVYRRRFVIEVVWAQPATWDYIQDWGAVIGDALTNEAPCLWDIDEGEPERLERSP